MKRKLSQRYWYALLIAGIMIFALALGGCGDDDDDDTTGPSTCGGVVVDGYCWYLGATWQSCDEVCANRGGCNAAGITYAGSQGSSAACEAVLNALGAPADTLGNGTDERYDNPVSGIGCTVSSFLGGVIDRVVYYSGTCGASPQLEATQRACACNL